jgi:hypothetical protein
MPPSAAPLEGELVVDVLGRASASRGVVPSAMLARPVALGSSSAIRVRGPQVLPEHALLFVRGGVLHVASIDPNAPVYVDGRPAPTYWVPVSLPCRLAVGQVAVTLWASGDPDGSRAAARRASWSGRTSSTSGVASPSGALSAASLDLRAEPASPLSSLRAEWRRSSTLARAVLVAAPALALVCALAASLAPGAERGDEDAAVQTPAPPAPAPVDPRAQGIASRGPLRASR